MLTHRSWWGTTVARGRQRISIVALGAAVTLAGCGSGGATAAGPREAGTSLPIASAPATSDHADASRSPSAATPVWTEPDDPVAAYHELIEKVGHARGQLSTELFDEIYAPGSRMSEELSSLRRRIDRGVRVVDGRTVVEAVRVLSEDPDTALLEVKGREEGWVRLLRNGERVEQDTMCEQFVAELRRVEGRWRIATIVVDETKSFWRCDG